MTINSFGHVVEVDRASPQNMTVVHRDMPGQLGQGQVIATLDQFALTANNATYALFGEAMGYWNFFPASDAAKGIVPVWGFATVTQSAHGDIAIGTQLYGFWPFAQHVLLEPAQLTQQGFSDSAAHRQALHAFYNLSTYTHQDPFSQGDKTLVPALKPLFSTAWLLEDFFSEHDFFSVDDLLLTSASSKTGLATAFCVKDAGRFSGKLIGLTSARNAAFVEQTGLYDAVLVYEDIGNLEKRSAALIDFAGNADVLCAVHSHYGDALKYSGQVGKTHAASGVVTDALAGPKPVLFFAPDQARDAMKRLGAGAFQSALYERWTGFTTGAADWFDVEMLGSLEDAQAVLKSLMGAHVDGSKVYLVSP